MAHETTCVLHLIPYSCHARLTTNDLTHLSACCFSCLRVGLPRALRATTQSSAHSQGTRSRCLSTIYIYIYIQAFAALCTCSRTGQACFLTGAHPDPLQYSPATHCMTKTMSDTPCALPHLHRLCRTTYSNHHHTHSPFCMSKILGSSSIPGRILSSTARHNLHVTAKALAHTIRAATPHHPHSSCTAINIVLSPVCV